MHLKWLVLFVAVMSMAFPGSSLASGSYGVMGRVAKDAGGRYERHDSHQRSHRHQEYRDDRRHERRHDRRHDRRHERRHDRRHTHYGYYQPAPVYWGPLYYAPSYTRCW